jgi:hypothetical protein
MAMQLDLAASAEHGANLRQQVCKIDNPHVICGARSEFFNRSSQVAESLGEQPPRRSSAAVESPSGGGTRSAKKP